MKYDPVTHYRNALLSGAALATFAVSGALWSVAAVAQEDEATAEEELEEVLVTGSRIRRAEYDSVQPTVTIDSGFIDDRGFTNLADALNEIPSFGIPGNSTTGGQGITNAGSNFVNMFGLGSQRTLTLVNGRRVVAANAPSNFNTASPGLQVDLNIIPTALIERVENVSIGGAPTYGSDAIAGTVNVILKDDFEGVEIDGQYGVASRGDADNYRLRGAVGGNFDDGRGNAVVSVEFNEIIGLPGNARDVFTSGGQSFQPTGDCGNAPDGTPFGRCLINPARVGFATFGGLPSFFVGIPTVNQVLIDAFGGFDTTLRDANGNVLQFGPGGTLIPFDPGTRGTFIFAQGGDGINLNDLTTLRTPLKRFIATGLANYEITDKLRFFTEALYANSRSTDLFTQAAWWTDFFGNNSGAIEFSVDNPFLPAASRQAIVDHCGDFGIAPGECTFFVSRSGLDVIDGENASELNLFRIVSGLEGEFDLAGSTWHWDASYNIGRTRVDSIGSSINSQRLEWALDAVVDPGTGDIVCDVQLNPPDPDELPGAAFSVEETNIYEVIDQCAPLNLFGQGSPSAEARAFVTELQSSATKIQQQVFSANLTGDVFQLPAGAVGFAAGFEHRREQAAFDPDESYRRGGGRGVPVAGVSGRFDTSEVYGEVLVPIVAGGDGLFSVPLLEELELEGKIRVVDNSRAGSDETWTAGGRMRLDVPLLDDGLEIRGNFTRSIRAPALVELFLPTVSIFTFVNDPCDASNVNAGPAPATRRANCEALAAQLGATDGFGNPIDFDTFQSNAVNGTIQGTSGGNPNLANERANAFSVGGVMTPSFASNLTLAVDYVSINIAGAISQLNATSVAQACFDVPNFPNEFCDRLQRDNNFQLTFAQTGFENAGTLEYRAIQASFRYNSDLADVPLIGGISGGLPGQVSLDGSFLYTLHHFTSVTGFDENFQDGEVGRSKMRYQLNFRYDLDRLGLLWQTRYIGGAKFNNDNLPSSQNHLRVDDYVLFNATVSYQLTDWIGARVVVNNVFDQEPPFPSGASGNQLFTYDFLGRYFTFGVNAKF